MTTETKKSTHTPGPWQLEGTEEFGFGIRPTGPSAPIADSVQGIANARLIAAAPDLLDALRAIADIVVTTDTDHARLSALCAAIARTAIGSAEA